MINQVCGFGPVRSGVGFQPRLFRVEGHSISKSNSRAHIFFTMDSPFPISFCSKERKKKHTIKHLINIREYFHDIYFSQQITILLIQKKYPTTLLFLISAIIHHNSSRTAVSFLCVSNIPQEKMLTIKEYSQWSLSVYNQISHWEARTLHN